MIDIGFCMMVSTFDAFRFRVWRDHVWPHWQSLGITIGAVFDHDRDGLWVTCKRAWSMHRWASHWCVLSDDCVPMPSFATDVRAFVARHPHDALSIFQPAVEAGRIDQVLSLYDAANGSDFPIPAPYISWGGSTILPADLIVPTIGLADTMDAFANLDDVRITAALRLQGRPIIACNQPQMLHLGAYLQSTQPGVSDLAMCHHRSGIFHIRRPPVTPPSIGP